MDDDNRRVGLRPRLLPTILAATGFLVLTMLGVWQLDRAEQKRLMSRQYEERAKDAPIRLDGELRDGGDLRYRRVTLTGKYETDRQLLLDNQVHQGVVGFHVVTPLKLAGADLVVLVNRGWVPQGRDRSHLPDIALDVESRVVSGILNRFPQPGIKLGAADPLATGWPRIIQYFDVASLQSEFDSAIFPLLVMLNPDEPNGYVRDWKPPPSRADRHSAYAVQWFALAGTLAILFLFSSYRRRAPRT